MEDVFTWLVVIGVIFFRVVLPAINWLKKQGEKQGVGTGGGQAPDTIKILRETLDALASGLVGGETSEQIEAALRRTEGLIRQTDVQISRVAAVGATKVIFDTLNEPTLSDLRRLETQLKGALALLASADHGASQAFLRNGTTVTRAQEANELAEARLRLLEDAAAARHHLMAEVMADADAFAAALVEPLRQFAMAHGLPLPPNQPISLPVAPGSESMIRGLFAQHPVFFVPADFGEHIHRWSAVAHEAGHVLWYSEPTLRHEMKRIVPSTERPRLPRPVNGRLVFDYDAAFAGWLEEIVCDVFAMIMLGPAGFRGLCSALFDEAQPMSAVFANPDHTGRLLDEHPPPHLRVHMAAWLLDHLGYDVEMGPLLAKWQETHEHADYLVLPIAGTRQTVSADLEGFMVKGRWILSEMMSEEFRGLGGYPLSAVVGQELGPGLWARVRRRTDDILNGQAFHDTPRVVIAAGIEAAARSPQSVKKIAAAVRSVIVGEGQRMSDDVNYEGHNHEEHIETRSVGTVRDAILLWELLNRRPGGAPRRGASRR